MENVEETIHNQRQEEALEAEGEDLYSGAQDIVKVAAANALLTPRPTEKRKKE